MSWLAAALLVANCWTYVLTQDEGVYMSMRADRRGPGTLQPTVSRRTIPYHPVVRFRPMDLPPAFFYTIDEPPGYSANQDVSEKLTSADLVQLLRHMYEEEYHEHPPEELSKGTIRFGIIR